MVACSNEDVVFTDPAVPERPASEKVSLCFRLSGRIANRRAAQEEDAIRREEGNVQSLCYAIFKDNMFETGDNADLTGRNQQTGSEYLVSNLDKDLFDETTEIFAVANASEDLKAALLTTPPPTLENDWENPLLTEAVEGYIDRQARIATYDFLITEQLAGGSYPNDGLIYYLPANINNKVSKKYNLADEGIAFTDYASLIDGRNKETDSEKRAVYDKIAEDLECRLSLFRSAKYNEYKTAYKEEETNDSTYSKKLAVDERFTRYVLWRNLLYDENLDLTASTTATRLIDLPLMAGYLALTDTPGSIVTVPVEHIYSRIWFQFGFTGDVTAPDITVDKIEMAGLPQRTKVFNTGNSPSENNIEGANGEPAATVCISCEDAQSQVPFLADLTRTEAPWHLTDGNSENIPLLRFVPSSPAYNVVCRYTPKAESTELDTTKRPVRYYLYSYQWGGVATADDPLITVSYHYTETVDGASTVVRKRASARLYDENHSDGKLHHGVLRNYTYQVNCRINTASRDLEIQVLPHDWYQMEVDDIPSFD